MHLTILTRGIKNQIDNFIRDLQAQYFRFPIDGEGIKGAIRSDGKIDGKACVTQLAVRPIQLYELVFPKEALQDVLATVLPYSKHNGALSTFALRKTLGLKPVPALDGTGMSHPTCRSNHLDIVGVGIKSDAEFKQDTIQDGVRYAKGTEAL